MSNKFKKLYFTSDFSPENVKKLQSDGWILRNASAATASDSVEDADEYGGDVPEWYPQDKVQKKAVTRKTAQTAE